MRPTTALNDNVADLNALLHPGTAFEHGTWSPIQTLSLSEKRAILASWASDAWAISSCPSLRAPEGVKAPVTIDEIWRRFARWTKDRGTLRAESRCACGRSNEPRPGRPMVQTIEISQRTAEAFARYLARKLRRQVAEWKTMRAPARMHAAAGSGSNSGQDGDRSSSAAAVTHLISLLDHRPAISQLSLLDDRRRVAIPITIMVAFRQRPHQRRPAQRERQRRRRVQALR